jgi:alkylation response protein AidB-like acyl-CoA dehydrogenase
VSGKSADQLDKKRVNLLLNEEQSMIQDMARKFAQSELAPIAAKLDRGGGRELFLAKLLELAELGFMGMNTSAEYGGTEAGPVAFSAAVTEIARGCASTAVTMSVTNMVGEVIQVIGSDEQKSKYLPKLCSGEYSAGSFCLSEVGAGSDPASIKTRAVRDGDDWVLNGTKTWISSAEYAGIFVVWAVTDPSLNKGKGISCFLIEAGTPGLTIGPTEVKMGQHASCTNSVILEDCRISGDALLGRLNDGYRVAVQELAGGRIGIGSLALGIAQEAMDFARAYIAERKQFNQIISAFQGIQWMLADAYTELEAARLLLMNAAYLKEAGLPFMKQAAMAKVYSTEAANRSCYTALQLMGGVGYTADYPLERHARDVRVTSIYEGTSEIQRLIIARELLKEI